MDAVTAALSDRTKTVAGVFLRPEQLSIRWLLAFLNRYRSQGRRVSYTVRYRPQDSLRHFRLGGRCAVADIDLVYSRIERGPHRGNEFRFKSVR